MQNLGAAGGTVELDYLAVYFDAGAHTRPHTHETDQVLCFVRGPGFIWIAGEERQPVETHGVVVIPAGVLHMHGAMETSRSATSPSEHRARPTGARRSGRVAAVRAVVPAQWGLPRPRRPAAPEPGAAGAAPVPGAFLLLAIRNGAE